MSTLLVGSNEDIVVDNFAKIYVMLRDHADDDGVSVFNKEDWKNIVDTYDKKKVIEVLAHYIINNKPIFPLRKIEYKNMKKSFDNLLNRDICDLKVVRLGMTMVEYIVKLKYDYDCTSSGIGEKCLYMIQLGHEYNDASSYFQQENRLKCNSYGYKGPLNAWVDLDALKKMNWTFWRPSMIGKNGIRSRDYRSSMRVSGYVATQFKPHVAKVIYEMNNAKRILDTSCGWGDRLVGFYCTKGTEVYYGCDPNEHVYEAYKKQCIEYEKLLGTKEEDIEIIDGIWVGMDEELVDGGEYQGSKGCSYFECKGKKHVRIYNGCAEDIVLGSDGGTDGGADGATDGGTDGGADGGADGGFDLLFTSPPYFKTERYNEGGVGEELQSWKRYDTFEKWRDKFLYKMIQNAGLSLKIGGKIMLNIVDPQIKNKRYKVCDDMVNYVEGLGFQYDGWILQRMKGGPAKKGLCGDNWYGEPIFSFTKLN